MIIADSRLFNGVSKGLRIEQLIARNLAKIINCQRVCGFKFDF